LATRPPNPVTSRRSRVNEKPVGRDTDGLLETNSPDGLKTVADELLNAPTTGSTSGATAVRKAEAVSKSECFSGSSCGQRRQGSRGEPRNDDGLSGSPAPASRIATAWGPTSQHRGEGRPMPSQQTPTNQQGTEIVGRSGEWASAVNRSNGRRGQRNRPNALTLGDIFRRGARGSHRSQSACCCLIIRLLTAGKCLCY
jgi:hypothetical protein